MTIPLSKRAGEKEVYSHEAEDGLLPLRPRGRAATFPNEKGIPMSRPRKPEISFCHIIYQGIQNRARKGGPFGTVKGG